MVFCLARGLQLMKKKKEKKKKEEKRGWMIAGHDSGTTEP